MEKELPHSQSGKKSFLMSVIVLIVVPFVPVLIDIMTQHLNVSSLMLITALSIIGMSATSQDLATFIFGVFMGSFDFIVYGLINDSNVSSFWVIFAFSLNGIVLMVNIYERWVRHIIKEEPFFDFKDPRI